MSAFQAEGGGSSPLSRSKNSLFDFYKNIYYNIYRKNDKGELKMTVRDLVQKLLLEAPSLDSEVYIQQYENKDDDPIDFDIQSIDNRGTRDAVFIDILLWKSSR